MILTSQDCLLCRRCAERPNFPRGRWQRQQEYSFASNMSWKLGVWSTRRMPRKYLPPSHGSPDTSIRSKRFLSILRSTQRACPISLHGFDKLHVTIRLFERFFCHEERTRNEQCLCHRHRTACRNRTLD